LSLLKQPLLCALSVAALLPHVHAESSWSFGQFEDDRILQTVGAPSKVLYAVNLGGGALTTANGYSFLAGTSTNVAYPSTTATGYLGGGGTTGDANFDSILSDGAVSTGAAGTDATLSVRNLTVGKYYRIMLLFADTRAASSGFSVKVGAWGSSDETIVHTFGYNAGSQAIGSYASYDFPAVAATTYVYIRGTSSSRQINAVIVSEVQAGDLTPAAVTPTLNTNERVVYMATPEMFGAAGDGVKNDAPAFNAAIQSIAMMGQRTAGVLYLANRKYVFKDPVNLLPGVSIHGDWKNWTTGTTGATGATLVVRTGVGGTTTTPFLKLLNGNAVTGVNFWYPDQSASSIQPYGPTIAGDHDIVLRNIALINSYDGIIVNNSHYTIENIYGSPLHYGCNVWVNAGSGYISDLHFTPGIWPKSLLAGAPSAGGPHATWMYDHGIGLVLGRDDGDSLTSCSIDGYNTGVWTYRTVNGSLSGAVGASFVDCTISNTQTAFLADDMNGSVGIHLTRCTLSGLKALARTPGSTGSCRMLFHTCTLTSELGNSSVAIASPALTITNQYNQIQLTNCTVNGQIIQAGGSANLVNCTLNTASGTPQINMMAGTNVTSLTGCAFTPIKSITNTAGRLIDSPIVATTTAPPVFHWSTVEARRQSARPASGTLYLATASPYNAVGDGVADDTVSIQSALNAAGVAGGGIVYLPAGRYLTSGTLTVPSGVELRGLWENAHPMGGYRFGTVVNAISRNSVIRVTAGAGSTTGPSAIVLNANSGIVGVDFDYINQTSAATPYPATIKGQGANIYIIGVTVANAFNFVDLDSASCTNHFVYGTQGFAFENSFKIGNGATGLLANCDTYAGYWASLIDSPSTAAYNATGAAAAIRAYQCNHNKKLWLGNAPSEKIINASTLGNQYYLYATNESSLGPVAEVYNALADNVTVLFHFEGPATNTSVNLVNSYWVLPNPTQPVSQNIANIETTANFAGKARFYNYGSRMGPNAYDFLLAGGTIGVEGYLSGLGSNPGTLITGGCAQLNNVCLNPYTNSTAIYPVRIGGRGVLGNKSELINWSHPNGFDYLNTDPTNQALNAANIYSPKSTITTVITDQPIFANALYTFKNLGNTQGIDNGGSLTSGTDVVQWLYTATNLNQQWTVLYDTTTSPPSYKIRSRKSGCFLDSLGHMAAGTTVGQLAGSASTTQNWSIYSYGAGRYQLINAANGLTVDTNGSTTFGTSLVFAPLGTVADTTRVWNAIPIAYVPEGIWSVQNRGNSKMLDNLGSTADGAAVGQMPDGTGNTQKWSVVYNIDGYYRLQCLATPLYYLNNWSGAVSQAHNSPTNGAQHWTFLPADGGYFQLINRSSGLAVDNLGSTVDGAPLSFAAPASANNNQHWSFVAP